MQNNSPKGQAESDAMEQATVAAVDAILKMARTNPREAMFRVMDLMELGGGDLEALVNAIILDYPRGVTVAADSFERGAYVEAQNG